MNSDPKHIIEVGDVDKNETIAYPVLDESGSDENESKKLKRRT
jgi:hypothetical protein